MTFVRNIPEDFPPPREIVGQIRTNFAQYATVFGNNHMPLNSSTQGKHSNVILQQRGSDPEVEGGLDSLYGKSVTSASSTSDEVFVRIPQFLPNQQPNTPMQLTFNSVNVTGPDQYQSFLAGGYIIYFGQSSNIAVPITLVPTPSEIICVVANPTQFTTSGTPIPLDVQATVFQPNQIVLTSNTAATNSPYNFKWVAIAKQ